jgi:hypothetical protein
MKLKWKILKKNKNELIEIYLGSFNLFISNIFQGLNIH